MNEFIVYYDFPITLAVHSIIVNCLNIDVHRDIKISILVNISTRVHRDTKISILLFFIFFFFEAFKI